MINYDEKRLPSCDSCQTVAVIRFLYQIAEHDGFWRASDLSFIKLDLVQLIMISLLSTETEEDARARAALSTQPRSGR